MQSVGWGVGGVYARLMDAVVRPRQLQILLKHVSSHSWYKGNILMSLVSTKCFLAPSYRGVWDYTHSIAARAISCFEKKTFNQPLHLKWRTKNVHSSR